MMEASSAVAATLASSPWSDGGRSTTRGDRGSTGMGPAGWTSSPPMGMAATEGRRERVAESIGSDRIRIRIRIVRPRDQSGASKVMSWQGCSIRSSRRRRGSDSFLFSIDTFLMNGSGPDGELGRSDRRPWAGECAAEEGRARVDEERGLAGFRLGRQEGAIGARADGQGGLDLAGVPAKKKGKRVASRHSGRRPGHSGWG